MKSIMQAVISLPLAVIVLSESDAERAAGAACLGGGAITVSDTQPNAESIAVNGGKTGYARYR